MNIWETESSPAKQIFAAILCTLAGVLLGYKFRNFGSFHINNTTAGFLLGVLLLFIGLLSLITIGRQVVIINPDNRFIFVEDKNIFRTRSRKILFNEITDVGIGYLGKRSNFVNFYYLILFMESGEEYSLFAPGRFYKGSSNKATVEGWRLRLQDYLKQD